MLTIVRLDDSIAAILFGIPGTVAAQAAILDGFPMARRGEAARALGASFSASAIGGVFGAVVLFVSILILRPLVLHFGSPELFLLAILGISMTAVLSQGAFIKGIVADGVGLLLTTSGQDSLTGIFRYVYGPTFGMGFLSWPSPWASSLFPSWWTWWLREGASQRQALQPRE